MYEHTHNFSNYNFSNYNLSLPQNAVDWFIELSPSTRITPHPPLGDGYVNNTFPSCNNHRRFHGIILWVAIHQPPAHFLQMDQHRGRPNSIELTRKHIDVKSVADFPISRCNAILCGTIQFMHQHGYCWWSITCCYQVMCMIIIMRWHWWVGAYTCARGAHTNC